MHYALDMHARSHAYQPVLHRAYQAVLHAKAYAYLAVTYAEVRYVHRSKLVSVYPAFFLEITGPA